MEKIGQVMLISIIVGLMIFMVGVLFVNFLKPEITTVRSSVNLDCSNAGGITDGAKLSCLIVDVVLIYFIIGIVSLAGGVIIGRLI